jgi:hypothetical protein
VAVSRAYRPSGVVTYTVLLSSFMAGCCTSRPAAPGAGDSKTGAGSHADVGVARVKSLRPAPMSATHSAVALCSVRPCGATRPVKPRLVKLSAASDGATAVVPVADASTEAPCVAYTLPSKGDTVTARKLLPRRYVADAGEVGKSTTAEPYVIEPRPKPDPTFDVRAPAT